MKRILLISAGALIFQTLTGCSANKYWQALSVSQEGGIAFEKITEKEDLLDNETSFSISPDGEKIAFTSWKTGNGDIYIKHLRGSSALLQRTFRNESEWAPEFSPSGDQLAFHSFREGNYRVYLIGAESGSAIRQITTSSPRHAVSPAFSPDGNHIAFNSVDYTLNQYNNLVYAGNEHIWTYNIGNGSLTQYAAGVSPRYSPDGSHILFKRRSADGYFALWMINLESGAETNILSADGYGIISFDISPDGKKILLSSTRDTKKTKSENVNSNIWLAGIDGSDLTQLTFHPAEEVHPRWAPDMKGFFFLSNRGEEKKETVNVWYMPYKN